MRIVVVGGSGLIGSRLVKILRAAHLDVVAASPRSGVDVITGRGLADVLSGADVLVDVTDSRSSDGEAVLDFFVSAAQNLVAAKKAARVRHHVVLSVVGVDRLQDSAYFRAKAAQENLVKAASDSYTIVRSTQFYELIERFLQAKSDEAVVRVAPALIQPLASDDLAQELADIALAAPLNETIEIAGPETVWLNELARQILSAREDPRDVVADARTRYFGAELGYMSLMPGSHPRICQTKIRDWLREFITAG